MDDGPLCITCKHLIPDHLECRCDVSITTRVRQLSYSVTQAHFVSVLVELDGEFGVITEHNHPDLRERRRNRQKLHELSHEIQDEPVTVTVCGLISKGIREPTTVGIFYTDLVLCFHMRKAREQSKNVR